MYCYYYYCTCECFNSPPDPSSIKVESSRVVSCLTAFQIDNESYHKYKHLNSEETNKLTAAECDAIGCSTIICNTVA